MTNEASSNAIIGNTLRIIASGEYHPGAELTQKMASYIIELEQKLTDMAVQLDNAESKCRELSSKAMELVCEASLVYSKYNVRRCQTVTLSICRLFRKCTTCAKEQPNDSTQQTGADCQNQKADREL